jgi:predicted dithiol-disulfide oxidoreductase (DUF899 family)
MVLRQLLVEHRALLLRVEAHEAALRSHNPESIDRAAREVELTRQRIALLEARRRVVTHQLAPRFKQETPTLAKLAELFPDRKVILLQIRDELRAIVLQIQEKTQQLVKVASGVLGHLNATVRIIAQAANGPSTYTRTGAAPLPQRVGVLEAVA